MIEQNYLRADTAIVIDVVDCVVFQRNDWISSVTSEGVQDTIYIVKELFPMIVLGSWSAPSLYHNSFPQDHFLAERSWICAK
jgi:hypothetical protein